ncbi:hypothetical protein HGM15179_010790 [Zosterops borbonicus]|uniref:Uncharacterized protein n=1 Tax=Zosterops borbonicus TaxID=364589 RepID=A0A8K1GDU5_9PASS|nr:hypothetical protein HGM15179_010790 [Zosterops borbonicus]
MPLLLGTPFLLWAPPCVLPLPLLAPPMKVYPLPVPTPSGLDMRMATGRRPSWSPLPPNIGQLQFTLKKPHVINQRPPSSSEDESSDSSCSDSKYEDRWAKTQRDAAQEGDWELANKISNFPVTFKWGRRTATQTLRELVPMGS